jgi:hypothetical protein
MQVETLPHNIGHRLRVRSTTVLGVITATYDAHSRRRNSNMQTQISSFIIRLGFWLAGGVLCLAGCSLRGGNLMFGTCSDWHTQQAQRGFTVEAPRAWKVVAAETGRIDLRGGTEEHIVIWPVFLQNQVNDAIAAAALRSIAAKIRPDLNWQSLEPGAGDWRRLFARAGNQQAVALFTWANQADGAAGCVYTIVAPAARYQRNTETYARILQSFRATSPDGSRETAAPTPTMLSFERWQDPSENAFSLDVPRGWGVQGGAYRFAPMDVRFAVAALSPDHQIRVTRGDAEIPTFALPSQADRFIGNTSGSVDLIGYRAVFKDYLPGAQFAREYVQTKVTRGCTDLQFRSERERPDLVQAINAIYSSYAAQGVPIRYEAGDVAFTCDCGGQSLQGYYLAATWFIHGSTGGALWAVEHLYGYLATSAKAAEAQAALTRMAQSGQTNPEWAARQQGLTNQTVSIGTAMIRAVSDAMLQNYWSHTRSRDEHMRRTINAIAGTEDVVDPQTGQQYNIYSGSNYYWIDRGGTIAGTTTWQRPDTDFREMVRLP